MNVKKQKAGFYSSLLFLLVTCCLHYCFEPWRNWLHSEYLLLLGIVPIIGCALLNCPGERIKFLTILAVWVIAGIGAASYFLPPVEDTGRYSSNILLMPFITGYITLFAVGAVILTLNISDCWKKIVTELMLYILLLPCLVYFSCNWPKTMLLLKGTISSSNSFLSFCTNKIIIDVLFSFIWKSTLLLVCLFFILRTMPMLTFKRQTRDAFMALLTCSMVLTIYYFYNDHFIQNWESRNFDSFTVLVQKRPNMLSASGCTTDVKTVDGLYFLIVGESHDYNESEMLRKKTDHFYKRLYSDPNFIIFSEVYSPLRNKKHGYVGVSQHAMCNMLSSLKKSGSTSDLLTHHDLFDVLKISGFKLMWLQNFGIYRMFANIQQQIFMSRADVVSDNDKDAFDGKYVDKGFQVDNELPGIVKKMYADGKFDKKKSFMVIKPLGLHEKDIIIPDDFRKKYPDLNEYCCGILYYNSILEKLFNVLRSFPETRAIVYSSDHSYSRSTEKKIVMFVYLSDKLKSQKPYLENQIKEIASKPYNTVLMYDLQLKIMDISVIK